MKRIKQFNNFNLKVITVNQNELKSLIGSNKDNKIGKQEKVIKI
jgi:hypothetical protein